MLAIIVVTYNSAAVIGACLDSCLRVPAATVVVVDNNSSDATVNEVVKRPAVRLLANDSNRGFAGAANQGIGSTDEPFVLLLNPDAVLQSGLGDLLHACRQPGVGAAGGRLVGADGCSQEGFNVRGFPTALTLACEAMGLNRIWPGNPVNRAYRVPTPQLTTLDVAQPAGAMLMIRRSAWQAIGGFDERFHPIWFEDVDFCWRLRAAGYRIGFVPHAVAEHIGGHSAARLSWASRQLYWYGSLLRYASKHFSTPSRVLVTGAVAAACVPRMIIRLVKYRTLAPISVYSKVMWLSGVCLMSSRSRGGLRVPQGFAVEPGAE